MEKSNRFIRVTKDNRSRDRGIIAVDAICAAFENQESNKTEIMTLDGFWYEVVDSIEDVYAKLRDCELDFAVLPLDDKNINVVTIKPYSPSKTESIKLRKVVSPAAAEDNRQKDHEYERENRRGEYVYPKKGYGYKRRITRNKKVSPSGEGDGHYILNPKSEHITPQIGL